MKHEPKEKEYPLVCDVCKQSEIVSNRKLYAIDITEVIISKNQNELYTEGCVRRLQICEECFVNSELNTILKQQKRQFVIG